MKNWRKKLSILCLAGLTLLSLAGCGSSSSSTNNTSKLSGNVVLYTSQPEEDAQKLVEAFNKVNPNVKVQIFRSGTKEVASKILAEQQAGAVQADLVLLADAVTFESLKSKDILEPYESPELKTIPAKFVDKDHFYTGTKIMTTGIIYNTKMIQTPPKTFAELATSAYDNKIVMPSPLYSGAAAFNIGIISRTPNLGWPFIEKLQQNHIKVEKGNGAVLKSVVSGNKSIGLIVDYMVARAKKDGAPVEFVYPNEGSPTITEPIALTKASKNKEAAKAFIDFILSDEGQKLAANLGYTPIREGIPAPSGLLPVQNIKFMEVNVVDLFQKRDADKAKFTSLIH